MYPRHCDTVASRPPEVQRLTAKLKDASPSLARHRYALAQCSMRAEWVFGACGSRDPRSEYEARAASGWPQAAAAGRPRQRWPPPQGGHMSA